MKNFDHRVESPVFILTVQYIVHIVLHERYYEINCKIQQLYFTYTLPLSPWVPCFPDGPGFPCFPGAPGRPGGPGGPLSPSLPSRPSRP